MKTHNTILVFAGIVVAGALAIAVVMVSTTIPLSGQVRGPQASGTPSTSSTQNISNNTPAVRVSGATILYNTVVPGYGPPVGTGGAAISPDGQFLVFGGSLTSSTSGLYVHNLETGQDQLIVQHIGGDDVLSDPRFAPDGKHIAFVAAGPTWYYPNNIYSVGVDGSGLTALTNTSAPEPSLGEELGDPNYSPDGTQVMMSVYVYGSGNSYVGLVRIGAPAGEPERIVEGSPLVWSSDGTSIYYSGQTSQSGLDNASIYRFDLRTNQAQAIKTAPDAVVGYAPLVNVAFIRTTSTVAMFNLGVPNTTNLPVSQRSRQ